MGNGEINGVCQRAGDEVAWRKDMRTEWQLSRQTGSGRHRQTGEEMIMTSTTENKSHIDKHLTSMLGAHLCHYD